MACKTCGDERIDSKYNCHACEVKRGRFKWCVITDVPRKVDGSDDEGNCYDALIELKDINTIILNGHYIDYKARPNKDKRHGMISYKAPVFQVGEVIPIANSFGREIVAGARKPSKWDIEYELFAAKDYKKAILRSIQARDEYDKPYDNLRHLESKFQKRQRYMDHG